MLALRGEQLRDLGGQIYKVELIISIGEARVSPAALALPPLHLTLILFIVVSSAPPPSSKATGSCRCSDKVTDPVLQADVHSAPFHQRFVIQREQTLWEQIGAAQRIEHKKSRREPDRFYALKKKGVRWGGCQGEKSTEQNFMGGFFLFIQRLLCVGYSKSSIHPHPGGKSPAL